MLLKNTDPRPGRAGSRGLVVLIHGWARDPEHFYSRGLLEAVEQGIPDADILTPRYSNGVASGADPLLIAKELAACIQEADRRRGNYEEIILIGYSLGSLLVRKAYVFARGENQDDPAGLAAKPQDWASRVGRIILLSGLNRGWSLSGKPEHMWWSFYLCYRLVLGVVKPLPSQFCRLVRNVERGEPFVANLRVQWLNLQRSDRPPAPTIQILGSRDEVVSSKDNVDVQVCSDFIFLQARDTGHLEMVDFRDPSVGDHRKEVFLRALVTPIKELPSDYLPDPGGDPEVERVIFLMHGIRDFGHWTRHLRRRIEDIAEEEGRKVYVQVSGYGYFPLLGFLLPFRRQRNVRWFMDVYTEAMARFPEAKMGFIGHSNGTYLLARAMRHYASCDFDRVAFAGSVVPRGFEWDELIHRGRLTAIRNDLAAGDMVVATFPRFFEMLHELRGSRASDIGSGGVNGFVDDQGQRHQYAYFRGGHSAALQPANYESLGRFVLGSSPDDADSSLLVNEPTRATVLLSKFCWVVWLVLVALVAGGGVLLLLIWGQQAWPAYPWAPLALFLGLVWLLLSTL